MSTESVRLTVRLQPRSSRDEVIDWNDEGALRVRVKAAPVKGAANEALIQLLAKTLGVPKRDICLVAGATGRNKIVEIIGLTADDLKSRLTHL